MWKNVHYTVPLPSGESRTLLNGVTGYLKPGSLTALVGASGAGKTTALDVFAQRKTVGVVTGEIRLGGDLLSASFGREVAYGMNLFPRTTCYSTLTLFKPSRWIFMNQHPQFAKLCCFQHISAKVTRTYNAWILEWWSYLRFTALMTWIRTIMLNPSWNFLSFKSSCRASSTHSSYTNHMSCSLADCLVMSLGVEGTNQIYLHFA